MRAHHTVSSRWHIPGRYYSFTKDKDGIRVSFIVLDTENRGSSSQIKWFKEELRKAQGSDWIIVYGHHPMYSSGSHGGSSTLQRYYKAAMQDAKVALLISGHDHQMEYMKYNDNRKSMDFVLSGAGAKLRSQSSSHLRSVYNAGLSSTYKNQYGFAGIEISGSKAKITYVDRYGNVMGTWCKTNPKNPYAGSNLC